MIIDLDDLSDGTVLDGDVCVVGTGAAGLAVANELLGTGRKILILEAGGRDHEPKTQDLYDCAISGLPFWGYMAGRFRVIGGSTTMWKGQALPFCPIDFESRDWVAHSGWPITYDNLVPYYRRAMQFLWVDDFNYDTDLFQQFGFEPPAFDPSITSYHFSKWSPQPNIRVAYLPLLRQAANATVVSHANVTRILLDDSLSRVREVHVRSLSGRAAVIRARYFVLCVGGIETARVLLSNDMQQKCGIGNSRDLVGRYFQDHPAAVLGTLRTADRGEVQRLFNLFHRKGLKYSVRLTAAPEFQRRHRTLNISAAVLFDVDPDSAFQALKDSYRLVREGNVGRELARRLVTTAGGAATVMPSVYAYLVRRRTVSPNATFRVSCLSEQEPNPASRILLSERRDALGIPRSDVRWRLTDLTLKTYRLYADALAGELRRLGIGELERETWLEEGAGDWERHMGDQYHHMGTARMADSPDRGVVDAECRVHGIPNLSIGSSAVFPTSGHSNPTLTLIALSLRIADRLKSELCASYTN